MNERRSQLAPPAASDLDELLATHARESLEWVKDLDSQLTRLNYLTNGGAALAILAFLGTDRAPQHMAWPLLVFTLGVIVTGIEIRALLKYFSTLHSDASQKRRGFINDELTVAQIATPTNKGDTSNCINHWAGIVAQSLFVVGVMLATLIFLCTGT